MTEPKVGPDGKKQWEPFFQSMDDAAIMRYCVTTLQKMPMKYLQMAGKRLSQVK
ncbi:MAG: hypothetical protein WC822_02460 [Candidatus Paceibacterota bacterium]|jgi:hypothetical protein